MKNSAPSDNFDDQAIISSSLMNVLRILRRGFLYAENLHCDASVFAIPRNELVRIGATSIDLRSLQLSGYVRTVSEKQVEEHFALTKSGYHRLCKMFERGETTRESDVPHWCNHRRELVVGGTIVKAYRVPSPNQQTILQTFQEDGWPPRIDDPLSPLDGIDAKRRLGETVKSLNNAHKVRRIRFYGDGTGSGICWRFRTDG